QRRAPLTSLVIQRMTVMTLLGLKHESAVTLQSGAALQIFCWDGLCTPGIHHRTPRCVFGQMSQCAEAHRNQQNREYGNWPASPALLTFAGYKGKRQQDDDSNSRTNQQDRGLCRWRQERQQSIQP